VAQCGLIQPDRQCSLHYVDPLFIFRILCYNAGLEDPSKLGEPEREYIDEILGRIYAIEYSPKGRTYKCVLGKKSQK